MRTCATAYLSSALEAEPGPVEPNLRLPFAPQSDALHRAVDQEHHRDRHRAEEEDPQRDGDVPVAKAKGESLHGRSAPLRETDDGRRQTKDERTRSTAASVPRLSSCRLHLQLDRCLRRGRPLSVHHADLRGDFAGHGAERLGLLDDSGQHATAGLPASPPSRISDSSSMRPRNGTPSAAPRARRRRRRTPRRPCSPRCRARARSGAGRR